MQNTIADRIVLPDQFAGVLVEGDDRRGARRRDVRVTLILTVRRADEHEIAIDDRGRVRQVVRIRPDLFNHVEGPDDVRIIGPGQLLVAERTVDLAVAGAVDVEAPYTPAAARVRDE